MSIKTILARMTGTRPEKSGETISYDTIFSGEAATPAAMACAGNFLPGLRAVNNDVDIYFKDVFAGPVF